MSFELKADRPLSSTQNLKLKTQNFVPSSVVKSILLTRKIEETHQVDDFLLEEKSVSGEMAQD
jgi:hypothetical protein